MWKSTRKKSGYVPWPKNNNDDLFPCCRTCQQMSDKSESANKAIWYKTANVLWLRAEWFWDFGHMLPAGFINYGVGVTPPVLKPERHRVFVFKSDFGRGYLDLDLEAHASAGAEQHETRVKVVSFSGNVNFPGEIVVTRGGQIWVATPRTTLFGKGVEIFERYIFQAVEMPFDLPVLTAESNFVKNGDTILLNGIALN